LAQRLTKEKIADATSLRKIEADIKAQIDRGVQFALDAPYPEPSEAGLHVYA
jgi:TPP-dependent pyruvate/acetoin dehydrogenase alpha subunit